MTDFKVTAVNLRKHAKGKPCMIRIPGKCSHNPDETVLCHIRQAGITGAGQKSPDLLAAWGCARCHSIVDGREITSIPYGEIQLMHYQGVMRTQYELIKEGLV